MHRSIVPSNPTSPINNLSLKLLDGVVHLAGNQRQGHDSRDVHLRAENVHVEIEFLADGLDVLETFLVVGTCATDPDLDLVLVEERRDFAKGTNNALECACDLHKSY